MSGDWTSVLAARGFSLHLDTPPALPHSPPTFDQENGGTVIRHVRDFLLGKLARAHSRRANQTVGSAFSVLGPSGRAARPSPASRVMPAMLAAVVSIGFVTTVAAQQQSQSFGCGTASFTVPGKFHGARRGYRPDGRGARRQRRCRVSRPKWSTRGQRRTWSFGEGDLRGDPRSGS